MRRKDLKGFFIARSFASVIVRDKFVKIYLPLNAIKNRQLLEFIHVLKCNIVMGRFRGSHELGFQNEHQPRIRIPERTSARSEEEEKFCGNEVRRSR